jgi:hypothetical protein
MSQMPNQPMVKPRSEEVKQQILVMENERKKIADAIAKDNIGAPIKIPEAPKPTFLQKNQWKLIGIGVPVGFYAFSKYKKYDAKKTAKVTIIGSVVVIGLVILNGFSGAWDGITFMEQVLGKKNRSKELEQTKKQ